MTPTEQDRYWLLEAIELAKRCPPSTTAFAVGAIIVSADGVEVARGYSRDTHPTIHAEESALARAGTDERLATATIYSSLEPCGERKSRPRTCAQLIIESGIRRVVYGSREPTTYVDEPHGQRLLKQFGLEVTQLRLDSGGRNPGT